MGWSSGSDLAGEIWDLVGRHVPADKKKAVLYDFILAFQHMDCDTMEDGPDDSEVVIAAVSMRAVDNGAPPHAHRGATFTDDWDRSYVYDGTYWFEVDE